MNCSRGYIEKMRICNSMLQNHHTTKSKQYPQKYLHFHWSSTQPSTQNIHSQIPLWSHFLTPKYPPTKIWVLHNHILYILLILDGKFFIILRLHWLWKPFQKSSIGKYLQFWRRYFIEKNINNISLKVKGKGVLWITFFNYFFYVGQIFFI